MLRDAAERLKDLRLELTELEDLSKSLLTGHAKKVVRFLYIDCVTWSQVNQRSLMLEKTDLFWAITTHSISHNIK